MVAISSLQNALFAMTERSAKISISSDYAYILPRNNIREIDFQLTIDGFDDWARNDEANPRGTHSPFWTVLHIPTRSASFVNDRWADVPLTFSMSRSSIGRKIIRNRARYRAPLVWISRVAKRERKVAKMQRRGPRGARSVRLDATL